MDISKDFGIELEDISLYVGLVSYSNVFFVNPRVYSCIIIDEITAGQNLD
jgi:hypothetical protein